METINEVCELTPPCECDCNPDKDLSQGNIRPNYSPSPCGADSGVCGEHLLEHPLHLWAIKYGVEGHLKFIGVAVVQAPTRSAAECIFAKNSLFSGTPERLKILAMKEVMPWSEPILFEDCAAIIDRHNLKSYPFLLKSDYEHNIQNISDNVIEAVEDYIEHNPIQQVQSDWNEANESSKAFIQNKPTIPEAQVNADWDSESGKSQILNKPTDLVRTSDIEGLLRNDGSVYTGKYLEQVQDLDNFQASEGKIVQYIGETNTKYTNGYIYKKVGTQTIIPAGTKYINVQDTSGRLAAMNVPNGIYYKVTDLNDTVVNKIRYHLFLSNKNSTLSDCVPVTYVNNVLTPIVGVYGCVNLVFSKITSYQVENSWYATLENGSTISRIGSSQEAFVDVGLSVNIYENPNGKRIYIHRIYQGNDEYACVLLLDYAENLDIYPAIAPLNAFKYKVNTASSSETIGVDEWRQWDSQPREDTSHFVTDSEIGWIEH